MRDVNNNDIDISSEARQEIEYLGLIFKTSLFESETSTYRSNEINPKEYLKRSINEWKAMCKNIDVMEPQDKIQLQNILPTQYVVLKTMMKKLNVKDEEVSKLLLREGTK